MSWLLSPGVTVRWELCVRLLGSLKKQHLGISCNWRFVARRSAAPVISLARQQQLLVTSTVIT